MTGRAASGFQLQLLGARLLGPDPIRDVWISVQPGVVHAFYGKNGAGKTRLAYALADLLAGVPSHESYLVASVVDVDSDCVPNFGLSRSFQFAPVRNPPVRPGADLRRTGWERQLGDVLWQRCLDLEPLIYDDRDDYFFDSNEDWSPSELDVLDDLDEDERADLFERIDRSEESAGDDLEDWEPNFGWYARTVGDIVASRLVALTPSGHGWDLTPAIVRDPAQQPHLTAEIDAIGDLVTKLARTRSDGEYLDALRQAGLHNQVNVTISFSQLGTYLGHRSMIEDLKAEAELLESADVVPYRLSRAPLDWDVRGPMAHGPLVVRDDQLSTERATERTRTWLSKQAFAPNSHLIRGPTELEPRVTAETRDFGQIATHLVSTLLVDAPNLTVEVLSPERWFTQAPVRWRASDLVESSLEIDELSEAQRRWALLAIALSHALRGAFSVRRQRTPTVEMHRVRTLDPPPIAREVGDVYEHQRPLPLTSPLIVIVLDEPDGALHATAQRHAVEGLCLLAERLDVTVFVSTHSREFLNGVRALHVSRDVEGGARVAVLEAVQRARCDELGLAPADLLLLSRALVIVEGAHDQAVLEAVIGHELASLGALMLPMRGGRMLASVVDAGIVAHLTDLPVIAVLDNLDGQRVQSYWNELLAHRDDGQGSFDKITNSYFAGKKKSEEHFLIEYCRAAAELGQTHRFRVVGLSRADIPEYLPVAEIVPKADSWQQLRTEHAAKAAATPFKTWLHHAYGVNIDSEMLRAVATDLDEVPGDFLGLLEVCRQATRRRAVE